MEMTSYERKKQELNTLMKELAAEPLAVAFSGGVDSSLLLKLAVDNRRLFLKEQESSAASDCEGEDCKTGDRADVIAITADSQLHPSADLENAKRLAKEMQAEHEILTVDEFAHAKIADNPPKRCYLCKKYLLGCMQNRAKKLGITVLIEGSNLDDTKTYRPGLAAVKELGVISPLIQAGFTKQDVRAYAAELGITSAERPASPCLATRFPYGTHLTRELLTKVEQGERFLQGYGFDNVRLRVHGDLARIEVPVGQLALLLHHKEEIAAYLRKLDFCYITADLEGFSSGSMDKQLGEGNGKNNLSGM